MWKTEHKSIKSCNFREIIPSLAEPHKEILVGFLFSMISQHSLI